MVGVWLFFCSVTKGSIADSCGLKVGDQILEVNGHSFRSILHAEAVSILKAYPTLMITVKVGTAPRTAPQTTLHMYMCRTSTLCVNRSILVHAHRNVHMYVVMIMVKLCM